MEMRVHPGQTQAGRGSWLALLWLVFALAVHGFSSAETQPKPVSAKIWSVRWQPERLVNGSPIFFQVKAPLPLKSLSGKWLEHDLSFSYDPKTRSWSSFAGIGVQIRPGVYTLALSGTTKDEKEAAFERRVIVRAAKYRRIEIKVDTKYTAPSPEQQQIISRDKAIKDEVFHRPMTPDRQWSGAFAPPLKAPISDTFGTQRTFNGEVKSTHQGLDFGALAGASVSALNSGTVLLARPLYFEGNCVVLDHGQGLFTLYFHLSELKVKEGDSVERGQSIGLVGGTGRATGPHLHVSVRWQGVYLDPATLLDLKLP